MAQPYTIRTARLTDRQVLDLIYAIKGNDTSITVRVDLIPHKSLDISSLDRSHETIVKLYSQRHAIQRATISDESSITISFLRGIAKDQANFSTSREPSAYFDEFVFQIPDRVSIENVWNKVIDYTDIIEKSVPAVFPLQETEKSQDAIDVLRGEVASLADLYKNALSDLQKERADFRKIFDEERMAANKKYEEERSRLNNEAIDKKREFEQYKSNEESALQKRKQELDTKQRQLDDRQHMHARRDLRDRIATNFKARAGRPVVSRRASAIRWIVFGLTLASGGGLGYFGIEGFGEIVEATAKGNPPLWLTVGLLVRSGLSLVLAVGFVAYAINWLRVVYLDDVRTERRYESNGDDIDRASFVIETLMEVGEKEKAHVPDAWVEGVCRNLFADRGEGSSGDVPANAAAAMLLEAVSGAKIGPDGTEVSLDRRGARKLAKNVSG